MLADELKERLKSIEPDLAVIKAFWANASFESEYENLLAQTQAEDFWQHKDQTKISKRLEHVKTQREQYLSVINGYREWVELVDLFADNDQELERMRPEIALLVRSVKKLKIELLLSGSDDNANCFMSINAGAGGTESQDWAHMVERMYVRFCQDNRLNAQIIDEQMGEGAGIKSAVLYIKGKNAYGLLKSEHGIHRLVRISPFDANKRRHTSFCGISVVPEAAELEDIVIDPKDLRVDTYRSSGAGGQHVNKTESAVRITHTPTNIVVQCQNERSQIQNRETAMKMLKARLVQKQKEELEAKQAATYEKKSIEWGSQIRSYVLHPYKMVKDHRTDFESSQPDLVLDGDLMPFIENYLVNLK